MRKLILSALLVAATSSLFAQKLDDIQEKIGKKKYGEAKEKVDAALADPKNQANSDFWFAKAQAVLIASLRSVILSTFLL